MAGYRSLEQALTEFVAIIVPLGHELGGPTASTMAIALVDPITSFFSFIAFNIIGFAFLRYGIPTSLHALRCGVEYLSLVTRPAPRRAYRIHTHVAQHSLEATRGTGYHARRARASETSSEFESWEDFSKRCNTGELAGDPPSLIDDPFTVREVSRLTTEPEVRSAYMRLMTMYQPDCLTREHTSGSEKLQNASVHVQQTYETLTERLYRTP